MEAVLCSKKRTDKYLVEIQMKRVQTDDEYKLLILLI